MNVMIVKQVTRKCFSIGTVQNVVGIRLFANRKPDPTQFSLDAIPLSLLCQLNTCMSITFTGVNNKSIFIQLLLIHVCRNLFSLGRTV